MVLTKLIFPNDLLGHTYQIGVAMRLRYPRLEIPLSTGCVFRLFTS